MSEIICGCGTTYLFVEGGEDWLACPNCGWPYKYLGSEKPKWISVEDRLPEDELPVLVANNESGAIRLFWRADVVWWAGGDQLPKYISKDITHWMPLPDSPE